MAMLTFLVFLLPVMASVYQPRIVDVPRIEDSQIYIVNIAQNVLLDVQFIGDPDTVLNLSGRNLRMIKRTAFNNVRDVESLDLSNNALPDLQSHTFYNLTKLKRLTLANNYIRSTTNAFIGLNNLQLLDLSHNPFIVFVPGSLFGVPHSTRILINSMEDNTRIFFTSMNRDMSMYTPIFPFRPIDRDTDLKENIKQLTLHYEINKNTRAQFCISNGIIKSFDILGKNDELGEGCVTPDLNFQTDWSVKFLHYIDKGAIAGFQKYWYQAFSLPIGSFIFLNDMITEITQETLNDLPYSVTVVRFDYNQIRKIRSYVIRNCYLKILSFQANVIEEIEDNAFAKTRLQELNLDRNQLESLNFVFTLPATITNLRLTRNRITFIPNNVFCRLLNMAVLDLEFNNIKTLPNDIFCRLPHLTYLNLQHNQIETLPNNILYYSSSLETLLLGRNNITTIEPDAFKGLTALIQLQLEYNSIRDLHVNSFVDLTALEFLDLSGNKFIKVPSIYFPRTLNTLYLEHNEISALEKNSFVEVPRHDLHLNGNPISRIARGAFDLPILAELYIENTDLTTIDGDSYEGLNGLTLLHLSENKISEIRKGSCKNLKALTKMVLTSNPLQKLESGAFYGLKINRKTIIYFEENNLKEIQSGLFENI